MHQSCLLHQMSSAPLQDTNTPAGHQHDSSAWLELIYHKPSGHFGIHRTCTGTDHSCGSWVDTLLSRLMPVLCLLFPLCCMSHSHYPMSNRQFFPLPHWNHRNASLPLLGNHLQLLFLRFSVFLLLLNQDKSRGTCLYLNRHLKIGLCLLPLSQLQQKEYSQ